MNRREEFRNELIQELHKRGYEGSEVFCLKNNGEKDGIAFYNKSTFSPVLYLDEFYEEFQRGKSVSKLAERLIANLQMYHETEGKLQNISIEKMLGDYSQIRKDVRLCMVSRSLNEALLAETPHYYYGDFAAVVYWMPFFKNDISIRMLLKNDVLEQLKVDFHMIFKDAYINMMNEFELRSMEELLIESYAEQVHSEGAGEEWKCLADQCMHRVCQGLEMYLLTHKSGIFGSAAMCYQRELQKAASKMGEEYIIIPASVNELILIPFKKNLPLEAINELIRQVNEEQLEQEERLAENVYVYSTKEKRIISDREYLQKTQNERVNELHQRSEYAAREKWRDEKCLM